MTWRRILSVTSVERDDRAVGLGFLFVEKSSDGIHHLDGGDHEAVLLTHEAVHLGEPCTANDLGGQPMIRSMMVL
jgi:hypothetical protein